MEKLNVSRKSIAKLFSELESKKFIIPDYQRKYDWGQEECETLWEDLENFYHDNSENSTEYFLGTIVLSKNENEDYEVIDGQQRISSILLLLRAFYTQLEKSEPENDDIVGLKSQIKPCIWELNEISKKVNDKRKIHLESKVISDEDKESLQELIANGEIVNTHKNSTYSKNYKLFYQWSQSFAQKNALNWYSFIVFILKRCILLPIECPDTDVALTIFNTLNDRGLPLSDSDIFKSQMFKYHSSKSPEEGRDFINKWNNLVEKVSVANLQLNDIFRYYSHIIRARESNNNKEIALRKFYTGRNVERLQNEQILEDILNLCEFWSDINNYVWESKNKRLNARAKQYINCLYHYPNEFWKYIISVYYYSHQHENEEVFQKAFEIFLQKLIAFLFHKFIIKPTLTAIKSSIYKNNIAIINGDELDFQIDKEFKQEHISMIHSYQKLQKGILMLYSYLDEQQTELLPPNAEIEHIFPQKWHNTNYNGWNKKDAEEFLEKLGNKMLIEKKVNIQASNNYFGRKKGEYSTSQIAQVKRISELEQNDWLKEDIENRDEQISKEIFQFITESLS